MIPSVSPWEGRLRARGRGLSPKTLALAALAMAGLCAGCGVHVRQGMSSGWTITRARPMETFRLPATTVHLADREDVQAAWNRVDSRPLTVSGVTAGEEIWIERDPFNPGLPIMNVAGHEMCHRIPELDARMPCSSAYRAAEAEDARAVDAEAWE